MACRRVWVKLSAMLSREARQPETIDATAAAVRVRKTRLRSLLLALVAWARFTAMMLIGMVAVWALVLLFG
jgi:hypothetical protein